MFFLEARNHGLWLHIDAAWAGVALACQEFHEACHLNGINAYADSFCTNFHKVVHHRSVDNVCSIQSHQ